MSVQFSEGEDEVTEMPALQVCAIMATFRSGPGLVLLQDGEPLLFQA